MNEIPDILCFCGHIMRLKGIQCTKWNPLITRLFPKISRNLLISYKELNMKYLFHLSMKVSEKTFYFFHVCTHSVQFNLAVYSIILILSQIIEFQEKVLTFLACYMVEFYQVLDSRTDQGYLQQITSCVIFFCIECI